MATVTVIIPSYNRKHFLGETLSSVFSQTFRPYEIIVVDDGSTDDTRAFLKTYEDQIRYVHKTHGGEASARNCGLSEASGEYIAFLDSDDLWEPSFLETTITHLEGHATLSLLGTACWVIPDRVRRPRLQEAFLKGDLFPLLFRKNIITASAVVSKRECFEEVGLFDENLDQATDYDMWLRIAKRYSIGFLNQPLCQWRRHPENVSHQQLRHRLCVLRVVQKHYDPSRIPSKLYRHRRSKLLVSLGRAYLKTNLVNQARGCFHEAVRLRPISIRPWQFYLSTLLTRG